MDEEEARGHILAFVAAHHTLTLATVSGGLPWATSLFYAHDDLTLYFVSDPHTRHAQNLAIDPRVAATIHEDYCDWRSIRGVQLEGVCDQLRNPAEIAHALKVYAARFPFIADLVRAPRELGSAMTKARFYKIEPSCLWLTDNTRAFGSKEIYRPPQAGASP